MSNQQWAGCQRPLSAFLGVPIRLIRERMIDPARRRARRRAGARELARLDDHLLRDIGLMRSQLHAAAFGPDETDWHRPADSGRACPAGPGNVVRLKRSTSAGQVHQWATAPPTRRAAAGRTP